jgi:hypothetical protein
MVGRDQFIVTMVWLATLNGLLAVNGTRRQLVRPIHPIDACIDMMLIRSSNLEDARYPRFFSAIFFVSAIAFILGLLMLDGRLVGDIDETFAVVLDAIN